jgi:hypothetical protein
VVEPSNGWKLALAVFLLGTIFCGACARPPRQAIARGELRRLVLAAVALYAVGAFASLAHRGELAGFLYATGILVCSLAVWLSRGVDADDPPDGGPGDDDPPGDERPPPAPDGFPAFDWDEFERELADYTRERSPSTS